MGIIDYPGAGVEVDEEKQPGQPVSAALSRVDGLLQEFRSRLAWKIEAATAAAVEEAVREKDEEIERLRGALEGMCYQFAYREAGGILWTGGLSALEYAFQVMGWKRKHHDPDIICQHEGCEEPHTCGTPTPDGYKRLCEEHMSQTRALAGEG